MATKDNGKENNEKKPSKTESELNIIRNRSHVPPNLEEKILDLKGIIQQKAGVIRTQPPVNWLPYLEADMISKRDYTFVTAYQRTTTKEDRDKILEIFKGDTLKSLVSAIKRVCVVGEIRKVLVLIDDMLYEDISRVELFDPSENETWKDFNDLLYCADDFVRNISSRIITKLITSKYGRPKSSEVKNFLLWLKDGLKVDNEYLLSIARSLQRLLTIDEYRLIFMSIHGTFRIIRLLNAGVRTQAQYQFVFCIWVSSFNTDIAERLNAYGTIPVFVGLLEKCPSEMIKLPRIIFASFRNLLEKPREDISRHNALLMIQYKIFKCIFVLKNRINMIDDEEFLEDFDAVEDVLNKYIAELSTFDEYKLEVKSGRLEWSVVHTSKLFWNKNADRLNENKYELLRILVTLLKTSGESTVLCVAAHDLGEYMNHYPRGRKVVLQLGAKDVFLGLLNNEHPAVKYHALKTLQILMLNNYELLEEYVGEIKMNNTVKDGYKFRSSELDPIKFL